MSNSKFDAAYERACALSEIGVAAYHEYRRVLSLSLRGKASPEQVEAAREAWRVADVATTAACREAVLL